MMTLVKDPGHSAKKCRWQATAKTHMHSMYVASDNTANHVHCMVVQCTQTTQAETAAVSPGTSHVRT